MLTRLFIRHIGLLKNAEILPAEGLTAVTGETGAGKSMLMDALSLTLGERADTSLIRQNEVNAQAEATFSIAPDSPLVQHLDEAGILLEEGELTLRRMLVSEGSNKAFANGARVTTAQLKQLGERLADIHGQHEHQMLLNSNRHSEMLDRFGDLKTERTKVRSAFRAYKAAELDLKTAQNRIENQAAEEAHLKTWLDELDALNYNTGEEENLMAERLRLMSTEQVGHALAAAMQAFVPEDVSVPNLVDGLAQAERAIQAVADKGGEGLATLAERLADVYNEVQDISADLAHQAERNTPDPQLLEQVDNRLNALRDIARKHKVEVGTLPDVLDKLTGQYNSLNDLQENLTALEEACVKTRTAFEKACKTLTTKRQTVAESLGGAIEKVLKTLHMQNALFRAKLEELPPENWGANGAEKVVFHVSTNPGQPLQPLTKIASGGEVSRLMLALKVVFYKNMPPMTLVFDEIDTGLGGAVADAVGDALHALSRNHQVFAITHQPQVAAKGDAHLKIDKLSGANSAQTTLTMLDETQRQQELARMLSGKEITPEAKAAAGQLLRVVK